LGPRFQLLVPAPQRGLSPLKTPPAREASKSGRGLAPSTRATIGRRRFWLQFLADCRAPGLPGLVSPSPAHGFPRGSGYQAVCPPRFCCKPVCAWGVCPRGVPVAACRGRGWVITRDGGGMGKIGAWCGTALYRCACASANLTYIYTALCCFSHFFITISPLYIYI